jgi:integrase
MASVEKRVRDGRTTYLVRWRDEAGKQRKKSFPRKVDADRYRAEVEHSLNVGTYVDPVQGKTTLRVYAERWRAMQPHRPNTAANTRSRLEHHVYPVLGGRPIAALRTSELQAFVTGLELAPGSVRPVWGTLRAILRAAVVDRAIGRDPCVGVKLPEMPVERVVPLTVAQVDALVDGVPPRYRALLVTTAGTGLRQGEAFGVQLRDDEGPVVDFLRKTLRVQRQIQPKPGGGTAFGPLKNKASYRTLPIGQVVVDALAAHLKEWPAGLAGLVFTDEAGQPLHRGTFNDQVWHPARERAGLSEVTMHDLRHFYASALIRAGLNVRVVADRLGHANAAMTLNVYSHLWPDDEDRTRQAIDEVFGADVPRTRPAQEA